MTALSRLNPYFRDARPVDYGNIIGLMDQGYVMMGWADPFFPDPCLPDYVIDAAKTSLDGAGSHYTAPIGSLELRKAIAAKLRRFNHLDVDPATEIVITPGSDMGLWHAMQVVIAPGDEVLNPEPSYPSNYKNVGLMGGHNVLVPLDRDRGFALDLDAMEARVTPRTKAIVLTQPNNPTTTVHDRAALEGLSRFAIAHDLIVVADHAFEETVADGRELVTIASLPGMWERTISVFSTSKGMAMSGFRVGYNVASAGIMRVLHASAVNVLGATNTSAQAAALAAFGDSEFVAGFQQIYARRRRFICDRLNDVPGVHCPMPQSGFMVFPDVSALGSSRGVWQHLLDDSRIIVSPGDGFGPSGEGHLRIMLSALRDEAAFEEVVHRLCASLERLTKTPRRGASATAA